MAFKEYLLSATNEIINKIMPDRTEFIYRAIYIASVISGGCSVGQSVETGNILGRLSNPVFSPENISRIESLETRRIIRDHRLDLVKQKSESFNRALMLMNICCLGVGAISVMNPNKKT